MSRANRTAVVAVWAVTRTLLVLFLTRVVPYPGHGLLVFDVHLYDQWTHTLQHGAFPTDDPRWQYPPGAAALILLPRLAPGGYAAGFVGLALLADGVVLGVLLRAAHRGASAVGPWLWVAGIALLGPVVLVRYDLMVTAIAVVALVAQARARSFGVLVGLGAVVKVWPVALLAGLPRGRPGRRTLLSAVLTAAVVLAVAAVCDRGALAFLRQQDGRGLQIESVAGSVFLVAHYLGWPGTQGPRYGSAELVGPGVDAAARVCLVLTVVAVVGLLWWRRRAVWRAGTVRDAALTAVLLFVVTSRVLSAQYLVWLVGLAAVCLLDRRTSQRTAAALVLAACVLTQAEFPSMWGSFTAFEPAGVAVVVARNALLVAAVVASGVGLWGSTRGGGAEDAGVGMVERAGAGVVGGSAASGNSVGAGRDVATGEGSDRVRFWARRLVHGFRAPDTPPPALGGSAQYPLSS